MTKVAIIGAGKGGRALLEMFAGDPTVTILGVADVNAWAPGRELARRLNIPVATERIANINALQRRSPPSRPPSP